VNRPLLTLAVSAWLLGGLAAVLPAADSAMLRAQWANPPREYSAAPFWVWNDQLTDDLLRTTLKDLASQGLQQVIVHPRPGLMTPYLSDEWFRLWKLSMAEAERLGMNLWIYDENSYPSGFAGGWVPELMPDSGGRSVTFRQQKTAPAAAPDLMAVFRIDGKKCEDVTAAVRAGKAGGAGTYLVARLQRSTPSPWYGNRTYVDLLSADVTRKFLEVTLEPYRRKLGEQFGLRIPGSFTDEPRLEGRGGVPWTTDLAPQFQRRWGYDLMPHLICLSRTVGDWQRVRHNFLQLVHELFVERWAKPYYQYCARSGIEFTGHYWEHEWPRCEMVPDNMAMYAWMQRPGIDCLMNQYREDVHSQFGNVRAVRELSSVANQLGLKRTICEAYGAGGWDLRMEDMKRIGDWLCVLGVNTLNEHLSYVSMRGERKHDHPQSFSYHDPWWTDYHVLVRYFTRLSLALSEGQQRNQVLVLEPTTTAWLYQFPAEPQYKERLTALGDRFQELLVALERAQVEYDLGCEDVLANHASVEGKLLRVGKRSYATVVLPPLVENLNAPTVKLLDAYVKAGGRVISAGPAPTLLDGRPSPTMAEAARRPSWSQVEAAAVPPRLAAWADDSLLIRSDRGDRGLLFHQRRQLDDGELLFLVNTSIEAPAKGTIVSTRRSAERWDPETGSQTPYPAAEMPGQGGRIALHFELPPCGSLLLFLASREAELAPIVPAQKTTTLAALGPMQTQRVEPNVLTLDYVDVRVGAKSLRKVYYYQAAELVWKEHGLDRNPWDHAVQFRDELISKKFPAESGFEVSYRFTIKDCVPRHLAVVIERPDLYAITCNGRPVVAQPGAWWLDRAFGRLEIGDLAQVGPNEVVLRAQPFTMFHEIQPAYVLGDFVLRPAKVGFQIAPGAAPQLDTKGWSRQGHPFYAAGVSYAQEFNVPAPAGRYEVALGRWYGAVARVVVNGQTVGRIYHQPWRCDVTAAIRPGKNRVEVVVVGTLKNPLGPHHGKVTLGSAWPAMFHVGPPNGPPPGGQYHTVEYGLFEPFQLQTHAVR
jgi:hypothetical protein